VGEQQIGLAACLLADRIGFAFGLDLLAPGYDLGLAGLLFGLFDLGLGDGRRVDGPGGTVRDSGCLF